LILVLVSVSAFRCHPERAKRRGISLRFAPNQGVTIATKPDDKKGIHI
jgi:hypothetical protein